jgi:FkbH-like protein
MRLNEALKAAGAARRLPVQERGFLVCGFEPLHLPIFLQAQYASRFVGRALGVEVGLFGDVLGNVERALQSQATLAWVVLEWGDLDSRLGLRSTGPWSGPRQAQIAQDVGQQLNRLRERLELLSERMPVVVAPPSLGFALMGQTSGWQASEFELTLELELARFLAELGRSARIRVLHPGRIATESPAALRGDPGMALAAGFPFSSEHASALSLGLIELAFPRPVKKGLITDLDDTLWAGLVGEIGPAAVSWSQAERTQLHGLYQSSLRQLSEAGVLLAIASKNDKEAATAALARKDLGLDPESFYPVAVSWGPKSQAVTAILRTWNVAADAVVVVDDSRMELEEIRRVHPEITCLEFAPKDPRRSLALLLELRDLFGKPVVLAEDRLRAASIRTGAAFEAGKASGDLQGFLEGLEGTVTFDARKRADDERLLELLNKTNQFNLNGVRMSAGEWLRLLRDEAQLVVGVAYADRYGALGTIGLLAGRIGSGVLHVEHWVLSCRAFSRRIEDHMLAYLFDHGGCERLRLAHRATAKNGPVREFLGRLGVAPEPDGSIELRRDALALVLDKLPHQAVAARD